MYLLGGQRSAQAFSTLATSPIEQLSTTDMSLVSTPVLANPSNGSGRGVPSTLTGHSAAAYGTRLIVFGGGTFIGAAGQTSGGLVFLNDVTYIETNSTSGNLTWRRLMHADGEQHGWITQAVRVVVHKVLVLG